MVDTEYNIPSQWIIITRLSFPKKGYSLCLDKQRGIAKSCAISNIQSKILHRIKSVTESKQLGLRSDLRSGRSTTKHTMTLCFHLDVARTHKRSLTVVFAEL